MRKVSIFSTLGNNEKHIMTNATIWGDLQVEIASHGIGSNGMKVVVGESQVTLESNQAELPAGDFTLFFMPQKVKSGYDDRPQGYSDSYDLDEDNSSSVSINDVQAKILSIGAALNELYEMMGKLANSTSPEVTKLQDKAEQLKKNLGLFD